MICENAYYKPGEDRPYCKSKRKSEEDEVFKDKCPLIFWCSMARRYENTGRAVDCIYRKEEKHE